MTNVDKPAAACVEARSTLFTISDDPAELAQTAVPACPRAGLQTWRSRPPRSRPRPGGPSTTRSATLRGRPERALPICSRRPRSSPASIRRRRRDLLGARPLSVHRPDLAHDAQGSRPSARAWPLCAGDHGERVWPLRGGRPKRAPRGDGKAGLPPSTYAAFRYALDAWREGPDLDGAGRLKRRMIERVLTPAAKSNR